jgi:hypothetical protein
LIALEDVNGDGVLDLVGFSNGIMIMLGSGDGCFQEQQYFAVSTTLSSPILGDVNGDGTVDLVGLNSGNAVVLLGNGDGSFQEQQSFATGYPVSSVKLADVKGDGTLDLVLYNNIEEGYISVMFNGKYNN